MFTTGEYILVFWYVYMCVYAFMYICMYVSV